MLARDPAELDVLAALAVYREQGWVSLGQWLTPAALAALRERSDDLMLGRVRYEGFFYQHDSATGQYADLPYGEGFSGPSLHYRKLEKLEKDPLFWQLLTLPLFARVAHAWMPGPVTLYRAVLFNKAARGGTVLPWHQDGGRLWGLDREPSLQAWIALDDAPVDAGCLEVLPGSHAGGLATPLGGMVPAPLVAAARADERKLYLPARAGEVLLIHNHLWHGSARNQTDSPRRGVTICYLDGRTRCVRTRKKPRQFREVFGAEVTGRE